jgi:YD repeat-containing protein
MVIIVLACNLPGEPVLVAEKDSGSGSVTGSGTPTLTLTATFNPTTSPSTTATDLAKILVSVSMDTNCRSGPGTVYPSLGVLIVGQTAEVVGRSASSDNWIILLPSNVAITCWLWGYYATVTGDTTGLIVYSPPPTPTPSAGFTLTFLNSITCGGVVGFKYRLVNIGSVTWESYRVVTYDATTGTTTTFTWDSFMNVINCVDPVIEVNSLEAGGVGETGNWGMGVLTYNPAGHNITATFTLCSLDGLTGQCLDKIIAFVP